MGLALKARPRSWATYALRVVASVVASVWCPVLMPDNALDAASPIEWKRRLAARCCFVLARGMIFLPRHAEPVDVLERGFASSIWPVGW